MLRFAPSVVAVMGTHDGAKEALTFKNSTKGAYETTSFDLCGNCDLPF